MRSHESEPINLEGPYINVVKELRGRSLIKDGSALWWNTDHAPDPREYMPFEGFLGRLVHLGDCQITTSNVGLQRRPDRKKDVYLYPEPRVPITVMELDVNGQNLPLLVTARPYHIKELTYRPFPFSLRKHPSIDGLSKYVASGGVIDLPDHFYPHIRGLFGGKRGNNYFWYPLHISSWWREFGQYIEQALTNKGLPFIEFYEPVSSDERTYNEVWEELLLKEKLVDQRRPQGVDFPYVEVSVDEFIEDYQKTIQDLLLFYPLRLPNIKNTLPLVISTRSHNKSRLRKPVVLGIYAWNGLYGRARSEGILRIRDPKMAEAISRAISADFGFPVDTTLFTPQKGRPKYERVPVE